MSPSHLLGLLAHAGGKNFPIFIPWPPFSFLATVALLVELRRPAAHLATGEPRAGEREPWPWPCIGGRVLHCCCRAADLLRARPAEGRQLQSCCGRCGTGGRETSDKYDCCSVVVQGGRWLPENMATNVNGEHLVFDF